MLWEIVKVKALSGYRLEVEFEDGVRGIVDMSENLWGPMFEPLRDVDYFAKVAVDAELGTVVWPNGADLAPEVLHQQADKTLRGAAWSPSPASTTWR